MAIDNRLPFSTWILEVIFDDWYNNWNIIWFAKSHTTLNHCPIISLTTDRISYHCTNFALVTLTFLLFLKSFRHVILPLAIGTPSFFCLECFPLNFHMVFAQKSPTQWGFPQLICLKLIPCPPNIVQPIFVLLFTSQNASSLNADFFFTFFFISNA